MWPFFEQWATGDKSYHHVNDRPRNAPVRTGVGVAAVSFYVILLLEGANDVIADRFDIPLYTVTWIARVAIFVVPVASYFITRRICLGLQRKDADMLVHGVEIGIIRQLPNGEFIEEERPLTEEERAVIDSKHVYEALPTPEEVDLNGVPAPAARGPLGVARKIANRAFTETVAVPEPHGDGHGHEVNGHEEVTDAEHASIGGSHEEH
jgi:ubiquinol-cytochrome c reductase cytochrome b subunit